VRGGRVRVCVADSGRGVSAPDAERIFERGYRGPGSTGEGLGLHTARQLMLAQGGDVSLTPTSHGAAFVITLPLAGEQVASAERRERALA
jgi:signal transduction histidine kinase